MKLIFVIFLVFWIGHGSSLEAETTIQKYFGSVTWQANSGEKSLACRVSDADPVGRFVWKLGNDVFPNIDKAEEVDENEYEEFFKYSPKIQDDGKTLQCSYQQLDDLGDVIYESIPDSIIINIDHSRFPSSPISAGRLAFGETSVVKVEFELYPDPKPENVVWSVSDENSKVLFPTGKKDNKYEAKDLENLGNHKFSSTFIISNADASDAKKEFILIVKSSRTKSTETRISLKFDIGSPKEPAPPELITTTTEKIVEEPEQPAQLSVGIIVAIVLIIIILILVAVFLYKRYSNKPQPYTPTDTKYQAAPTEEAPRPNNPA